MMLNNLKHLKFTTFDVLGPRSLPPHEYPSILIFQPVWVWPSLKRLVLEIL